ncbi:MAG: efflux RND transporter permease subunit [Bacteroidaceae bacterium]|nr:efflux RND transporter permease subunit [Bacteroidaceae bacterium]
MRTDISKWGLANKRIVWLFTVLLTVGGVISYYRMPKLEDPEIVVRQALVVGLYPGASAHQVELELTTPLENSINQTSDILFT